MQESVTTGGVAANGKSQSETTRMNCSLDAKLKGGMDQGYAAYFIFLIQMAAA